MGLPVQPDYCSQQSVAHGEPIVATAAPSVSVWLGVEIRGAWARDAFASESVPEVLRDALKDWSKEVDGLRPQALRRPGRDVSGAPRVVLAVTDPATDVVVRVDVESLEHLANVDLAAIVKSLRERKKAKDTTPIDEPMTWVCVHGKRDRCCAKLGAPVYEAAVRAGSSEVWQTSHLGGHRFAATLLCLPRGVCYGRVEPGEVGALVAAHADGAIFDLDRLRGRSCWSAAGQAAEHYIRSSTGDLRGPVTIVDEASEEDRVRVTVETATGTRDLLVEQRDLGVQSPPSCEKAPADVRGWFLVRA